MRHHWMMRGAKMIVFLIVGAFVLGLVVMLLWNAVIPDVFHGPTLTFWQALGLVVLSHLLFRGGGVRVGGSWKKERAKRRFEEKLARMSPEERDQFRAEWKKRCGWDPDQHHV